MSVWEFCKFGWELKLYQDVRAFSSNFNGQPSFQIVAVSWGLSWSWWRLPRYRTWCWGIPGERWPRPRPATPCANQGWVFLSCFQSRVRWKNLLQGASIKTQKMSDCTNATLGLAATWVRGIIGCFQHIVKWQSRRGSNPGPVCDNKKYATIYLTQVATRSM